ncbi:MAG: Spy/CpxP family protein refolding chaperone [Hyphomicrobiales bacterium]
MKKKQQKHAANTTQKSFMLALGMMAVLGAGLATTSIVSSNSALAHSQEKADKGGDRTHKKSKRSRPTEAQLEERASRMIERLSNELGANDIQREKISTLVMTFTKDVRPLRKQARKIRKDIEVLLLKDNIDRDKVEKLRKERLAEIDRATGKITLAMVEVAEVLSPEQRRKLSDKLDRMGKKRWHRR